MVTFTFWMGTRIESTIKGFTQEKPKTIQQTDTTGKESQQVTLNNKLTEFRHQIEAQKPGKLTLTADEINLAIVTFDILKPQRGSLHIISITPDGIRAVVSNPINSKMSNIITKEKTYRHLNATIFIQPELVEGAIFPRITNIAPDGGGSVPDEFRQQISKTLLAPFKDDTEIGPLFTRLSAVAIKDNTIILETEPGEQQTDALPADTAPIVERFMKGFALVAVVFLAIIGAIIILSRRKANQES